MALYIQDLMVEDTCMDYYELYDKYKFRPNYMNYLMLKTTTRYNLEIDSITKRENKPNINFDSAIFDTFVCSEIDVSK